MPTSSSSGISLIRCQIKRSGVPGSPRKLAQRTTDQCQLGQTTFLPQTFESSKKREDPAVRADKNNQLRPLTWEQPRQTVCRHKKMVHANPHSGKNATLPTDQLRSRIAATRNILISANSISDYFPRSVEKNTLNVATGQRQVIAPANVQMRRHVADYGSKDVQRKSPNFRTLNRTDHPRIPGRQKKTRALFGEISAYVPEKHQPYHRECERQCEKNIMFSEAFTRHKTATEVLLNIQKGVTPNNLSKQRSLSAQRRVLNNQNSLNMDPVQKVHQKVSAPKSHSKANQTFLNAAKHDRFPRVANVCGKHNKAEQPSEPSATNPSPQGRLYKVERRGGRKTSASFPNLLRDRATKGKRVMSSRSEVSTLTQLSRETFDNSLPPSRKGRTGDALKWQDHLGACRKEDLKQWCPIGERAYHVNRYLIKKVRDAKRSPETSTQPDHLELRNRKAPCGSKSPERNSPSGKSHIQNSPRSKATQINTELRHKNPKSPDSRDRIAHLAACSSDFSYSPAPATKHHICKTFCQQKLEQAIVSSQNNLVAPEDWVRIDRISTYSNEHRQLWFPTSHAARHKTVGDRETGHSKFHQKQSISTKVLGENDQLGTCKNECRRTKEEIRHGANCRRKAAQGWEFNEKNLTSTEAPKRCDRFPLYSNEDLRMRSRRVTPTHIMCNNIHQENTKYETKCSKLLSDFSESIDEDDLDEDTETHFPSNEKCHCRKAVQNVKCDKYYPSPPRLCQKNEKISTCKTEDQHESPISRHSKPITFHSRTSERETVLCKRNSICTLSLETKENADVSKNKNRNMLSPKSCCKMQAVTQHTKSKCDMTTLQNNITSSQGTGVDNFLISFGNECVHKRHNRTRSSSPENSQHRKVEHDSLKDIRKCSHSHECLHENQGLNVFCTRSLKHMNEERKNIHDTHSSQIELGSRNKKCGSRFRSEDGQSRSPPSSRQSQTCLQRSKPMQNFQQDLSIQKDQELRGYFENISDEDQQTKRNSCNIHVGKTVQGFPALKHSMPSASWEDVDNFGNKNPQGCSRVQRILHLTRSACGNHPSAVEGLRRCESFEGFSSDDQQTKHVCTRCTVPGTFKKNTQNGMTSTYKNKFPTRAQKIEDDLVITSYSGEDLKSQLLSNRVSNGNFHPRNTVQDSKILERRSTSVENVMGHDKNRRFRNLNATGTQPLISLSQSEEGCHTERNALLKLSHDNQITATPMVGDRKPGEESSRRCPLSSSSDRSFYFRKAMQIVTSLKKKEVLKDHIDGNNQQRCLLASAPCINQQQHFKKAWSEDENRDGSEGIPVVYDLTDEDEKDGCINCVMGKRASRLLKPIPQDEKAVRNSPKKSKTSRKPAPAATFPDHLVRRLGRAVRCLVGDSASDSAAMQGRYSASSTKSLRRRRPRATRTPNQLSLRLRRAMRAFMSSQRLSSP